jgi:HAD superfamily hydrolase (TIGR01509 family)
MSQKIKAEAIIFDCDGTLVDSETLSTRLIVEMLKERDNNPSYEDIFNIFRGEKFAIFLDKVALQYKNVDPTTFIPEYRERSNHLLATELVEINGAKSLLEKITHDKCIASNGPRYKIETSLKATSLLPFFENRIVSAYEVDSWKPAPGIVTHAAKVMGQPTENCLFIDDSLAGIEAGITAGAQVVAFRIPQEKLNTYNYPIKRIDELAEVLDLIY